MEDQYVSNEAVEIADDDEFTDVEIENSERAKLGIDQKRWKEEEDKEAKVEEKSGILHPNEKLPQPKPPAGVREGVDREGGKEGPSAVGRFMRERGSTLAWLVNRKEEEVKVIVQPQQQPQPQASTNGGLKGRVTFFTRSNCRDCGAVRSFLRGKGVSYVEINLDIYPSREKELAQRTRGSTTVPKIFFNGTLIGGLEELNKMRRSGNLQNKLKELLAGKCHVEDALVPAAPVYGVDDVAANDSTDDMLGIVRILRQRLPIQDRMLKLRVVANCFLTEDLLHLLQKHFEFDRIQAVDVGKKLVKKHLIHPVFGEQEFEDGKHMYRLLEHEPYIPKCYNFRGSTDELEPKDVREVGRRLAKIMWGIVESYASEDRRLVDYVAISNSEEFRRYLNLVHGLQRVDISTLIHPSDKLAFFLNLYNAMVIHAVIRQGHPQGMVDRRAMAHDFHYIVAGHPYSLNAIKNGILRANQRPPYSFSKPFPYGDKRSRVALPKVNPLIHFGLCDGTRSAPNLRFFTPENVEAELKVSTRDFFSKGSIQVDLLQRRVYLSSIIKWFSADFGSEKEILNWVINYLDGSIAGLVTHLLGDYGSVKIIYQSYDWSPNS